MSYVSTSVHVTASTRITVEPPGAGHESEWLVQMVTREGEGMGHLYFPADGVDLDRFLAAIAAARPGPPRAPSATSHPQGVVIPPEDGPS